MTELPAGTTVAERIATLKSAVGGLDREDVQRISLPLPDEPRRDALGRAVAAAAAAGRSDVLAGTRSALRHEALVRYRRAMLRPTWVGLNWGVSSGTVDDRMAIVAALDEAAVLAVTEDLLDEADRDVLGWAPELLLDSAAHTTDPGSLAHVLPGAPTGRAVTAIAAIGGAILGFGLLAAPIAAAAARLARRRRG